MAGLTLAIAALSVTPMAQSLLRPKVPPSDEMRAASSNLDLTGYAEVPPAPPVDPATSREHLIAEAHALVGVPYEWGAKGPDAFDCSGFTKASYGAVGAALPDGSFNQAHGEQPLNALADLQPGDLIFYRWPGNEGVTHVTMYLDDGWVIGTGSPGQPREVVAYPLASDLAHAPDTILTYRHVTLPDES